MVKANMLKILLDSVTEADGKTYDVTRLMLIGGVLVFLGLAIYNATAFNPQDFGIGLGTLLGGGGLAVGARAKLETTV
jgi:hypothetical protein